MNNIVSKLCTAALLLSATGVANAAVVNRVPEPGILELTALAAVVGYIVHKRRK